MDTKIQVYVKRLSEVCEPHCISFDEVGYIKSVAVYVFQHDGSRVIESFRPDEVELIFYLKG